MTDLTPIWILLGIVALWLLASMVLTHRHIKVQGTLPMSKIAIGIFIVLATLVILLRYGPSTMNLLLILANAAVGALSLCLKHGLGDRGVYMNGRLLKYEKMQYYHIELTDSFGTKIRFNSFSKDFALTFPEDKVELVKAYMVKNDVTPFELYQAKAQADMKKRNEQKAKTKMRSKEKSKKK